MFFFFLAPPPIFRGPKCFFSATFYVFFLVPPFGISHFSLAFYAYFYQIFPAPSAPFSILWPPPKLAWRLNSAVLGACGT